MSNGHRALLRGGDGRLGHVQRRALRAAQCYAPTPQPHALPYRAVRRQLRGATASARSPRLRPPCWAATAPPLPSHAQAGGQQLLGQRPAADPLPQLQIRCENVIKIPRQGCKTRDKGWIILSHTFFLMLCAWLLDLWPFTRTLISAPPSSAASSQTGLRHLMRIRGSLLPAPFADRDAPHFSQRPPHAPLGLTLRQCWRDVAPVGLRGCARETRYGGVAAHQR